MVIVIVIVMIIISHFVTCNPVTTQPVGRSSSVEQHVSVTYTHYGMPPSEKNQISNKASFRHIAAGSNTTRRSPYKQHVRSSYNPGNE